MGNLERSSGPEGRSVTRDVSRTLRGAVASFVGTNQARQNHRDDALRLEREDAGLEEMMRRIGTRPRPVPQDAPVFLLSAGWRSGSTMLQRLINSDGSILVWGEVYDRCALVQSMAESLRAISPVWPLDAYLRQPACPAQLSESWTANVYPPLDDLWAAHRAFMDRLFADPARRLGYARWGLKEVRFGLREARYLRWLYPDARIIFLQRDVFDAFESYKNFNASMNWYARWPSAPVFTPHAFARHWRRLSEEMHWAAPRVGAVTVTYEDLVSGAADLERLSRFCDISIDPQILKRKVGAGTERRGSRQRKSLNPVDRLMLSLGAGRRPRRLETHIPEHPHGQD